MALRGLVMGVVGMLTLVVGYGPPVGDPVTYPFKYYASVGGDASDSFEIIYFHDSTQNTIIPPGPAWEETFEAENPSQPHVEIDVRTSRDWQPSDSSPGVFVPVPQVPPPPHIVCSEVDGVEQASDEGERWVRCSVDLRKLEDSRTSEAPADSAAERSGNWQGVLLVVFVLLLLSVVIGGMVVTLRNARSQMASAGQTAPSSEDPGTGWGVRELQDENTQVDHELRPHVQLMVVSGAVGLLMLITGLVLSQALDPALSVPTIPSLPNLPDLPTPPGGGR